MDKQALLRVATSGDYRPFSYETPTGYAGFDIELAQMIAMKLKQGIEFKGFAWTQFDALIAACAQPKPPIDIIASGITVTDERRRLGFFSRPYLQMNSVILGPKLASNETNPLQSPRRIGVNKGGYLERLAGQRLSSHTLITTTDNRNLGLMIGSQVDCILTDGLEADVIMRRFDLEFWMELDAQEVALFIPKSKLQLAAEVDAIIGEALSNGTLLGIAKRHDIPIAMLPKLQFD